MSANFLSKQFHRGLVAIVDQVILTSVDLDVFVWAPLISLIFFQILRPFILTIHFIRCWTRVPELECHALSFCVRSVIRQEYCHKDVFRPQCWKNEVVLMTSAVFGRMRTGKCLRDDEVLREMSHDRRYLGCSVDVLPFVDSICSGRTECALYVNDENLESLNPCHKELRYFMEASYDCVTGLFALCASYSVYIYLLYKLHHSLHTIQAYSLWYATIWRAVVTRWTVDQEVVGSNPTHGIN